MAKGTTGPGHTQKHPTKLAERNLTELRKLMRKNDHLLTKTASALEELYTANEASKDILDRLAFTMPQQRDSFRGKKQADR